MSDATCLVDAYAVGRKQLQQFGVRLGSDGDSTVIGLAVSLRLRPLGERLVINVRRLPVRQQRPYLKLIAVERDGVVLFAEAGDHVPIAFVNDKGAPSVNPTPPLNA